MVPLDNPNSDRIRAHMVRVVLGLSDQTDTHQIFTQCTVRWSTKYQFGDSVGYNDTKISLSFGSRTVGICRSDVQPNIVYDPIRH